MDVAPGPVVTVVCGAVDSSTSVSGAEHAEALPAASTALARNEVVVLSATAAVRPGEAN